MQLSTLNFGICIAYWIDYAFSTIDASYAWRVPVILQCVFLIPMLGIIAMVPETPRWLAWHGRGDEALAVLMRVNKSRLPDEDTRAIHADIIRTVQVEQAVGADSWKDVIKNDKLQTRRRFLTACAIQSFQQLGGINAIIYYSGTLFQKSVGFSQHFSALMVCMLLPRIKRSVD